MAVNTKINGYDIDGEGIAKKLEEHWEQKNNKWFYYGEDGNLYKNKWIKYKGVWYYLLSNGEMKENGWEKVNGCWYYFVDGKMLSSQFINYNGDKYYLGESGAMAVNTKINGYDIDGEGIAKKLEEHWEQKNNKWFYYGEDGNLYKNKWIKYKGVWYYLLSNGEMKENGWEKVNGCWYYFVDGKMLSSQFINYNGDKYYLGESGAMAVNTKINGYNIDGEGIAKKLEEHWEQKNNKWFYYGEDGNLYKNKWIKYKGVWYYLLSNGEMKENGWEKVNGCWYYFVDGKMLSSQFINYNGDKYYLGESGAMAVNTKINGYNIDENGVARSASKPIGSRSEFIKKVTPGVLKAVKGKGLFPSIAVAQACLETGFGTDGLSPAPIYNLFGIKAADDTPPERYYEIRTAEYDKNGKKYYITDKFMKFSGYDEAFEYYAKLFTRTKWLTNWYRNVVAAKTPEQAAKALTGTYATDPNYGSKLLNIIDTYNLRELDKEIFPNGVKP